MARKPKSSKGASGNAIQNGHHGPKKSAVICVGSTGTGKSSTIAKCTGQLARVGDGHKSVTHCCEAYEYVMAFHRKMYLLNLI